MKYTFSVVKNARNHTDPNVCKIWDGLNIYEAVALYAAASDREISLNLYDNSGHCISLVQRVDGMDMLCSDYRLYDRWKYDPIVHIAIVPLLVESLFLRHEIWLTDISSVVFDRLFYLTGSTRIAECELEAYMDLDMPKIQNMEVEPLMEKLLPSLARKLGHQANGICVLQHLGMDYAFIVTGSKIVPCNALLQGVYELIKGEKE